LVSGSRFTRGIWGKSESAHQYEFVRLQAFAGATTPVAGSGPLPNQGLSPYNNIVFFSLRYYPFN
jgi:hypothetical protein